MKKYDKVSFATIVIIPLIILFVNMLVPNFRNNIIDKITWNKMSKLFIEENVSKVNLSGINNTEIELINEEKDDFIRKLRVARFQKSNWREEGPTPSIMIEIRFKDGTFESFGYWGSNIFETSYKTRQFLISSNDIKDILAKYYIKVE